jgi:uncharacterized membrane protein (UPF0127 family)
VRAGRAFVSFIWSRAATSAALLALCLLVLPMLFGSSAHGRMRQDQLRIVTATGEHVVDVEIADTAEEKALGLMFRSSLADTQGMLFPYEAPQEISMWMRNTYISLDMVFLRGDGTVHRIEERTEPLSERIISSQGPVTAVLELAGGWARRHGLRPGDRVRHPLFTRAAPG